MRDRKRLAYGALAIAGVTALVVIGVASGRLPVPGLRPADTPAPPPPPTADIPFDQIDAGSATMANLAAEPGVVHAALIAAPARLELVEGVETDVYAYNGRVPGPTLELQEGDRVTIRFRNDLAEPTTVHWHGLHLPIDSDGSPMNPVAPGEERFYSFTVPGGTAGT